MELNLKGKVAVITGGSAGIGKETAKEFLREGCKIAVCGRTYEKLEAMRSEIVAMGAEAYIEQVDICDLDAVKKFAQNTRGKLGSIDIWVNNAGIAYNTNIPAVTEEDWDRIMNTNLKAAFFGAQTAAEIMKQDGSGGVIINISSYAAVIPNRARAIYAISKTGMLSMTRTFSAEYAPYGIRVIAVIPGVTATEMTRAVGNLTKDRTKDIALQRPGSVAELAKPIVFLASDAASYITGVSLEISGGKFNVQKPHESWDSES